MTYDELCSYLWTRPYSEWEHIILHWRRTGEAPTGKDSEVPLQEKP